MAGNLVIGIVTQGAYGCFLKWWYPQNTPKWSFYQENQWLLGTTILGNIHMTQTSCTNYLRKKPSKSPATFGIKFDPPLDTR